MQASSQPESGLEVDLVGGLDTGPYIGGLQVFPFLWSTSCVFRAFGLGTCPPYSCFATSFKRTGSRQPPRVWPGSIHHSLHWNSVS